MSGERETCFICGKPDDTYSNECEKCGRVTCLDHYDQCDICSADWCHHCIHKCDRCDLYECTKHIYDSPVSNYEEVCFDCRHQLNLDDD